MSFKHSVLASAVLAAGMAFQATAANIDAALDKGVARAEKAQQAQIKIDSIDGDIRSSEREYRGVIKEVEGLQVYINQLDKQISAQHKEMLTIEESIRQVTLIERQITPLMLRMIDAMDQFVMADVPFLKEERSKRVQVLKNMMGRSDVTVAEKYRKVMASYQTEIDYGRTIESYRGTLAVNGEEREVDFLRIGRVSLMYISLDGTESGVWNNQSQAWQALDSEYKSKLNMGIRIAREQAAPDLIKVPVAAPSVAVVNTQAGEK